MEASCRDLVQSAVDDPEAFAAIVSRHQAMVYSIAYHCFQNQTLAEDLAQDVFLELYRRLRTIESDAHLTHWLRRAIVNKCVDHARWRKHHSSAPLEAAPVPLTMPAVPDPWLAKAIHERLLALPRRKRLVVILRFQEDLDLPEIAAALRMPVNTVKSTLHRALAVLRGRLAAYNGVKRYGTVRR